MKPTDSNDGSNANEMKVAIDLIGAELRAGHSLSDLNLEERFPHLMPALADHLRDLRMIIQAEHDIESTPISKSGSKESMQIAAMDAALDGYKVTRRIDHGGQGVVFGGMQESTQRDVAIKVMTAGEFSNEKRSRRFAREIRLASDLDLPNIVPVIDSGIVNGQPFLVMPMAYGLDVAKYAELSLPTVRDRVRMVAKIARAVSGAHQEGILHRDLKPSNIMVEEKGEPQILDFGLAKALTSEGIETETTLSVLGQVIGTLPFLSPEQAAGKIDLDERSDVYALGVLLFVLLTGTYPYDVGFGGETARNNILDSEPRTLAAASTLSGGAAGLTAPNWDDQLQAIVSTSIAKKREDRYRSADLFADDLEGYLAGRGVQAQVNAPSLSAWRSLRKYGLPLVATIATILLLVWLMS